MLGAEAALSGCFQECKASSGIVPPPGIAANTFFQHKMTNLFTVGPRLGYAWDRWMIFATGGYASANLKTAACSSATGLCDQTRFNGASRNSGWYAGGGLDYMVHKGPLSTCCSASNISISTSARKMRSASIPAVVRRPDGTKT